ncbi:MAG: hypothetical protein MPJ24_08530 [Pirellulaceae bacterium]|nr:hypothetical protein [Pirellulaceae bacterium]
MNNIVRNILAVVAGLVLGSIVNMGLVNIGMVIIPPPVPEGGSLETMDGIKEAMKLFTPINFLFPFLAHALGTLAGAFVAAKIATCCRIIFAVGIGLFFLVGGITMVAMVGGPLWFILLDLLVAYIPMAILGSILASGRKKV